MNEIPTMSPEEKETKNYKTISEYLSSFEESPEFEETLLSRKEELEIEHKKEYTREELKVSLRKSYNYWKALAEFYHAGNLIDPNIEHYETGTRKVIQDYWKYLKEAPRAAEMIKTVSHSDDDETVRKHNLERLREKIHTIAAFEIMGKEINLKNGDKIVCDEIEPENEWAIDKEQWAKIGRTLITIICEENKKDILDPEREERKLESIEEYLNGFIYKNGHWLPPRE